MNRSSSPVVERENLNDLTMNLIKIERVHYLSGKEEVREGLVLYVNPDDIQSISGEKSLRGDFMEYELTMKNRTSYRISEACAMNILKLNKKDHEQPL